jgi:hypothetical protein
VILENLEPKNENKRRAKKENQTPAAGGRKGVNQTGRERIKKRREERSRERENRSRSRSPNRG